MSRPRQVLLVDDNPDDRALVSRELRREFGEKLLIQEALAAGDLQGALGKSPDLVITDYQLRWTDGLEVLRAVKSRWPDCPVIMFTGTGCEEVAVEAMKSGLDDYVLKSPRHYARLPAAAQLAWKMGSQKRELKEAEKRYAALFETVPVGLYRATAEGKILEANPAMAKMLGYSDPASVVSLHLQDFHADAAQFEQWRSSLQSAGAEHHAEVELRRPDGRICWVNNHARALVDPRVGAIFYDGSVEDVTARKETEAEREKLIAELQNALAELKTLNGLLPICSSCKKIRDEGGRWNQIEVYIQRHSDAEFTHSFCPDCLTRLYPEIFSEGPSFRGS